MFGIKGKLISTKQKMFNIFRSIRGPGSEDSDASLLNPFISNIPHEPVDLSTNYVIEAELKKAEALMYYKRWIDRPK